MTFKHRLMSAVFAILPLAAMGCGGGDQRAKLDSIEEKIHHLEEMFPGKVAYAREPVEAVVAEAPEYTEPRRAPYAPEGLPRYFNDTSEWETTSMAADGHLVIPRTGMAAAVAGNFAYVLGGHGPGLTQAIFRSDVETIDPKVHVERFNTGLMRRRYQTAEAYQGKIYIMAGMTIATGRWDWRKVWPADLEIYDTATGTITKGSPIPNSRFLAASEILDSRIYLVGGSPPRMDSRREPDSTSRLVNRNTLPDNRMFIYDIAADRWTEGPPMEVARQCEVVAHGGKLYAVGGYDGRGAVSAFEEYDPKTNLWTRLPDLPFTLSGQKCVVAGDLLFSFGDYTEMTQICVYNFKTKKWNKLALHMKEPMRQGAAVVLKDKIFVIGGNAGEGRAIGAGGAGADPLSTIQVFSIKALTKAARAAQRRGP